MGAETRHKRQSRYAPTYDRIMIVYLQFYQHFALLKRGINENAPLLIVSFSIAALYLLECLDRNTKSNKNSISYLNFLKRV